MVHWFVIAKRSAVLRFWDRDSVVKRFVFVGGFSMNTASGAWEGAT